MTVTPKPKDLFTVRTELNYSSRTGVNSRIEIGLRVLRTDLAPTALVLLQPVKWRR